MIMTMMICNYIYIYIYNLISEFQANEEKWSSTLWQDVLVS